MPKFNRRRFLQIASAAGLAPLLPATSSQAAVSATVRPAQLLWGSLAKQAGSTSRFTGLAGSLGVSGKAAQGIYAKVAGTQVLAIHSARHLSGSVAPKSMVANEASPSQAPQSLRSIRRDVERFIKDDASPNRDRDEPTQDDQVEGDVSNSDLQPPSHS